MKPFVGFKEIYSSSLVVFKNVCYQFHDDIEKKKNKQLYKPKLHVLSKPRLKGSYLRS